MADESAPLLTTDVSSSSISNPHSHSQQLNQNQSHRLTQHWNWTHHSTPGTSFSLREQAQRFLTSRWGHYFVLLLVGIDVGAILASFLLTIFQCERARECRYADQLTKYGKFNLGVFGDGKFGDGLAECSRDVEFSLELGQRVLEVVSLVISCLFMGELAGSLWAFGIRYLKSWFHILDAVVIIAAFVVDVCLKGVIEEAGSVIVVLRLWRVFKIIEELSAGAEEQTDLLNEHIERLIAENKELRRRVAAAQNPET